MRLLSRCRQHCRAWIGVLANLIVVMTLVFAGYQLWRCCPEHTFWRFLPGAVLLQLLFLASALSTSRRWQARRASNLSLFGFRTSVVLNWIRLFAALAILFLVAWFWLGPNAYAPNQSYNLTMLAIVVTSFGLIDSVFQRLTAPSPPASLQPDRQAPFPPDSTDNEAHHLHWRRTVAAILLVSHAKLVGRDREVNRIIKLLKSDDDITFSQPRGLLLNAMGGMGKTALAHASCMAIKLMEHYDGIVGATAKTKSLRHRADDPAPPALKRETRASIDLYEFLVTISEQLGIADANQRELDDLTARIRSLLSGRRYLIVLDNLETVKNVEHLLSGLIETFQEPSHRFLVTCRKIPEDLPDQFQSIPVTPISDKQACRQLVYDVLTPPVVKKYRKHEVIDSILEIAQGLPLALRILALMLNNRGEPAVSTLSNTWQRRPAEAVGDHYLAELCKFVFDDQFMDSIGDVSQKLLQFISRLDEGVERDKLQRMGTRAFDMSAENFDLALSQLLRNGVLELRDDPDPKASDRIIAMHSVTRAYFSTTAL